MNNSTSTTRMFYGPYVYGDGDVLDFILHSEGRSRYSYDATTQIGTFTNDYFIKDHLGNVRTTITAAPVSYQNYLATHESANAAVEDEIFENMDDVVAPKPAPSGSGDVQAAALNGDNPNTQVGTSLLLHVMAGDKFNVSANAYYDGGSQPTGSSSAEQMLGSILSTLLANAGTEPVGEGPSGTEIVENSFTPPNYIDGYDILKNSLTNTEQPKAYLNYVLFDEDYQIVLEQSGAIQVNTADNWHSLQTNGDITINQGGYLAVYISNESQGMTAWFDNLNLKLYRGKVLEENHYYPYGMPVRISQDMAVKENKYLYQGKEFNQTENINTYDFHARQYDPLLGRFTSVDPMGQFASGYVGMGNNPTTGVDPSGMWTAFGSGLDIRWSDNIWGLISNVDDYNSWRMGWENRATSMNFVILEELSTILFEGGSAFQGDAEAAERMRNSLVAEARTELIEKLTEQYRQLGRNVNLEGLSTEELEKLNEGLDKADNEVKIAGDEKSKWDGYDESIDLEEYNCAGFAFRTYEELNTEHFEPFLKANGKNKGKVGDLKVILWTYFVVISNESGKSRSGSGKEDFHIVSGIVKEGGGETVGYSKNGGRPVYGPAPLDRWEPAKFSRATNSNKLEGDTYRKHLFNNGPIFLRIINIERTTYYIEPSLIPNKFLR